MSKDLNRAVEDRSRAREWIKEHPDGKYLEMCADLRIKRETTVGHSMFYNLRKQICEEEAKENAEKELKEMFRADDDKKVASAKAEMNKAIDESYALRGKVAEQEKIIYELREQLAVKEATPPEMLPADNEKLEELKTELEKTQAISKQIEAERDFYMGEDNDYKTKCAELETRLKNAEAGKEFAEAELEELKARVKNASRNEDLQAALDAANDELHNALGKIKDQQITIDGLERNKRLIGEDRDEIEAKYNALKKDYDEVIELIARIKLKEWKQSVQSNRRGVCSH